ncbi:hypothetical protein MCERE85_00233 [Candidatus Nanopelagicaceae bacterium]
MKRIRRSIVVMSISASILFGATPESFADNECAIDRAGKQVELCISNTIEGGGGSSGGGSLIYTLRPMSALFI